MQDRLNSIGDTSLLNFWGWGSGVPVPSVISHAPPEGAPEAHLDVVAEAVVADRAHAGLQ